MSTMENLKCAFNWILENSQPINEEECKELNELFNYNYEVGEKVVRISWFISDCFYRLQKNTLLDKGAQIVNYHMGNER